MLLLNLDTRSTLPLYRQIVARIRALIADGTLAAGEALPSSRRLAQQSQIHRSTVTRAFGELQAAGLLTGRPGRLLRVREAPRRTASKPFVEPQAPKAPASQSGLIDFRRLAPDLRLMPSEAIRRALNAALRDEGRTLLDYGDARGYAPLRALLAARLAKQGMACTEDEILLCNGAQQGMDLLLRLLTRPGDSVCVEDPGYSALLSLLARQRVEAVGIRMGEDGMDLGRLEDALAQQRPALIHTMPNFQNPTAITTDIAHREALLALARTARVPLIEDGFAEDLKYFGRSVPPLAALDDGQTVIHLGTFSKLLCPGLRVGWIAASRARIAALTALREDTELCGNTLGQAALYRFCQSGALDRLLRRMHAEYRRRMQTLLRAIRTHLPAGLVRCASPQGGFVAWLELDLAIDEQEPLLEAFAAAGVLLVPGSASRIAPAPRCAFRLSIAQCDEGAIETGLARIGQVLNHCM